MTGQPAPDPIEPPGALDGLKVVELASEHAAFAGKLLAGLGAEVTLVEPPGGAPMRWYEPFVDDVPDPTRSLWWWHYEQGKHGVTVDLDDASGAAEFRRLCADADVVVEGEPPGRLAALGLDHAQLRAGHEELIWVSVTPFGRDNPRAHEPVVDLTVLAGGGPVWNCGYDDHAIPPVRGGGNQGYQTASLHAVVATLVALLVRDETGTGQHVDVSMHAAANVTTEAGSYSWLVARQTVQRQTCRHAAVRPTQGTITLDREGRFVPTGIPPRSGKEFHVLLEWLASHGWRDEFPEAFFLQMGADRGGVNFADIATDPEVAAIFGAARDALIFIAERLTAYEFFVEGQQRGLPLPVVYAPEEVMHDPHYRARGFPVPVWHEELGRAVEYTGAPFHMHGSPWRLDTPAP
ncbi:MAG TPA: CoA transferase [Acidimicrobiia bacterium]|nr:CoA transferase [Acidimicrobiia bacterium]